MNKVVVNGVERYAREISPVLETITTGHVELVVSPDAMKI